MALTLRSGSPVVGADDWVDVGGYRDYAALIATPDGGTTELDGRLAALAASPKGGEQALLVGSAGLEWYSLPARALHVSLTPTPGGSLAGRVEGASGGAVEIYREQEAVHRAPVATVPLAADGSFTAQDVPPHLPTVYRAVYRDPVTGVPYAALTRQPVG